MSATQQSERAGGPDGTHVPQRFRAATVEEALRQVRASLGEDAEIVEANHIRRGGIGGFFATELGVEVVALGATDDGSGDPAVDAMIVADDRPSAVGGTFDLQATDTGIAAASTGTPPSNSITSAGPATPPAPAPTRPMLRARQAWRQAVGDDLREPVVPRDGVDAMTPGLEAMLAEAARSERATAPEPTMPADADDIPAQHGHDAPPTLFDGTGDTAAPMPTTFAEHFLRELIQDAEELRRSTDRNQVLPASPRTLEDGSLAPRTPDPDEPPAPPRRRTAVVAGATEPLVAPHVLPGMPSPLPAAPDAAPTARASSRSAKARSRSTGTRSAAKGATQPTPRAAAAAAARDAGRAAAREAAPELPLEPVAAAPAVPAAPAASGDALAELVDRCVRFAATADRETAPRKVALTVTLADGGVMKLTVELPRSI